MSVLAFRKGFGLAYIFINKKLRFGFVGTSGRAVNGKISVHHKGGGLKRKCIRLDYLRRIGSYGRIVKIIKTVFHTSLIGLILYTNGLCNYIVLSEENKLGMKLYSGSVISKKISNELELSLKKEQGHAIPLKHIKLFTRVNNIELRPYSGSSLMRSAKMGALISGEQANNRSLKLKSGWIMVVSKWCICSSGFVSKAPWDSLKYKKAGFSRALGIRPTVRGVAKNPCDHPHGGGNGKKSPPASARSPWGWYTKGTPTRKKELTVYRKKYIRKYIR